MQRMIISYFRILSRCNQLVRHYILSLSFVFFASCFFNAKAFAAEVPLPYDFLRTDILNELSMGSSYFHNFDNKYINSSVSITPINPRSSESKWRNTVTFEYRFGHSIFKTNETPEDAYELYRSANSHNDLYKDLKDRNYGSFQYLMEYSSSSKSSMKYFYDRLNNGSVTFQHDNQTSYPEYVFINGTDINRIFNGSFDYIYTAWNISYMLARLDDAYYAVVKELTPKNFYNYISRYYPVEDIYVGVMTDKDKYFSGVLEHFRSFHDEDFEFPFSLDLFFHRSIYNDSKVIYYEVSTPNLQKYVAIAYRHDDDLEMKDAHRFIQDLKFLIQNHLESLFSLYFDNLVSIGREKEQFRVPMIIITQTSDSNWRDIDRFVNYISYSLNYQKSVPTRSYHSPLFHNSTIDVTSGGQNESCAVHVDCKDPYQYSLCSTVLHLRKLIDAKHGDDFKPFPSPRVQDYLPYMEHRLFILMLRKYVIKSIYDNYYHLKSRVENCAYVLPESSQYNVRERIRLGPSESMLLLANDKMSNRSVALKAFIYDTNSYRINLPAELSRYYHIESLNGTWMIPKLLNIISHESLRLYGLLSSSIFEREKVRYLPVLVYEYYRLNLKRVPYLISELTVEEKKYVVFRFIHQICEIMQFLNNKHIYHQDLDPYSFFVDAISEPGQLNLKLNDFDIRQLRYIESKIYIDPRHLLSCCTNVSTKNDNTSDVYSLGQIILYMLHGTDMVRTHKIMEILNDHCRGLSKELWEMTHTLMYTFGQNWLPTNQEIDEVESSNEWKNLSKCYNNLTDSRVNLTALYEENRGSLFEILGQNFYDLLMKMIGFDQNKRPSFKEIIAAIPEISVSVSMSDTSRWR